MILDLYCGTGTIGLTMARECKTLIGDEIIPDAVENAKKNAARNGITNARFICADAAQAAEQLRQEGIRPDAEAYHFINLKRFLVLDVVTLLRKVEIAIMCRL